MLALYFINNSLQHFDQLDLPQALFNVFKKKQWQPNKDDKVGTHQAPPLTVTSTPPLPKSKWGRSDPRTEWSLWNLSATRELFAWCDGRIMVAGQAAAIGGVCPTGTYIYSGTADPREHHNLQQKPLELGSSRYDCTDIYYKFNFK